MPGIALEIRPDWLSAGQCQFTKGCDQIISNMLANGIAKRFKDSYCMRDLSSRKDASSALPVDFN
jgi:hypothetical protein